MELFKLFATLAIRNKEANDAIDETTGKAEGAKGKLSGAFSKIGSAALKVGKVIATGLAAGAGAVVAITKQAVDAYADYEQLVGGVETLFKDSADTVLNYANNAYKTAGLSANDYMETVTSFSGALLQSLNGDTAAAAKKADLAVTDMSDNMNKMGSSMESIQNAYQGFAKQNYTMLDNLKLGYGGTKEEMQRLLSDAEKLSGQKFDISSYSDVVDAIHIVQTEMGITGTTAKEASTTIQGSLSSLKASWQNLLVGLTDDSQDFDTLLSNVLDNAINLLQLLLPRITTIFGQLPKLIQGILPQIPPVLRELLPQLLVAAEDLLHGLVAALPELIDILLDILPDVLDAVMQIGLELVNALPQITDSIIAFLTNQSTITALIQAAITLFMALVAAIPEIASQIVKAAPVIIEALITGIIQSIPQLLSGLQQFIDNYGQYMSSIWGVIQQIWGAVSGWFKEHIIDPIVNFFTGLWNKVVEIWNQISNAISAAFQFIASIISAAFQIITLPFRFIWENCKEYVFAAFDAIKTFISNAINNIKTVISTVLNAIKTVWNTVWGAIKNFLTPIFNAIKNVVTTVFTAIKDFIATRIYNIKTNVTNVFNAIKNAISTPLNAAKTAVTNVFDGIKSKIDTVISGAKSIVKKGIGAIKGMFEKLKLKFPDIKLPHFGISPSGWKVSDLLEGSIPKLSIEWYAKAMDNGMILEKPTIFGVNAKGQPMGAGEAGSETVVGTNSLMTMIKAAVAESNANANATLEKILAAIINIDRTIYEKVVAALQTMGIEFDERELARLVKKYA